MRQAEQRKHDLQTRLVAVQAFLSSLEGMPTEHEARAVCLSDALLEREHILKELASAIVHRAARRKRIRPHNGCNGFSCFTHCLVMSEGCFVGASSP